MSLQRDNYQKKESEQKKKKEKESETKKEAEKKEEEKVKKNVAIERKSEGKQKNFYARASEIKKKSIVFTSANECTFVQRGIFKH